MSGRGLYYIDVEHQKLGKFRRITGSDLYVVQRKAEEQQARWEDQWRRRSETQQHRVGLDAKKSAALEQTEAAEKAISDLQNVLAQALEKSAVIDWKSFYDVRQFETKAPTPPDAPQFPIEPVRSDTQFQFKPTFFSIIIPSIRRNKIKEMDATFEKAHRSWQLQVADLKQGHVRTYNEYKKVLSQWQCQKSEFENQQAQGNAKIDAEAQRYLNKEPSAIFDYVDTVLARSDYPECFPRRWTIDYNADSQMLIIDYDLPTIEALPKLKAIRYIKSRDTLEEVYLNENEIARIYDSVMYKVCLRTIHEIFESDTAQAIKAITYNGWVDFVDKATGNRSRSCIMSLQANKEEFSRINLKGVDPKTCFRALKGVGSSKLAGMASVVPILRLNRNDDRFISARDVIDSLDDATNIAAIPWEEFEHLVRDIFEKEFSKNGGEVKITRASRDRGVDAIGFDPDPIRGGKVVIQAKRYTNTVDVSAVRDLFGTVMNEGATKGILVTTSHYGPDAYNFAKDKPLTLLDGGNLLHLLQKHGHRARIDLAEAKKLAHDSE